MKDSNPLKQLFSYIRESYEINKNYYFKSTYSPYCKLCDSCGEEGCCSPLRCMWKCMVTEKPKKCEYGEWYAYDIKFSYLLTNMYAEQIDLFRNNKITKEQFLEDTITKWDEIYDIVYKKDEHKH
jgi:hypothetical protein